MVTGSSCIEAVLPFKNPDYIPLVGWSRPMIQSSSSSAISSTEAVVSTTATFLVGGWAGEWVGRGGRFMKVVQDVAMCPFCQHRRQCPSLKHLSLSSGVSFFGFSLVSTSMALGSLKGVFLVGAGDVECDRDSG